jgi:hypothetical protein
MALAVRAAIKRTVTHMPSSPCVDYDIIRGPLHDVPFDPYDFEAGAHAFV